MDEASDPSYKVSFKKKYWNKKKPMLSPTTIKQTKRQLKSKTEGSPYETKFV